VKKTLLYAIIVILITGCSTNLIRSKIEEGIAKALPNYIGPAKDYKVRANGSTKSMINGFIEHLHIEGKEVEIEPGFVVSKMTVDMDEVSYEPTTRKLTAVKNTVFEAIVSEASLNNLIEKDHPNSDLKIELYQNKVVAKLSPSLLGVDIPISVTGRLEVVEYNKINFVADKASVVRLPVPAFAVNKVLSQMNPVFDLQNLRFPVKLRGLTIGNGWISIKGTAQVKPT
jgi:hypothetical protein